MILPGLLLLIGGGEWLVRGASRLASLLGVPPVVIGLSVVAFGTSAPELAVSVLSAYRGQPDIAVGNVVGTLLRPLQSGYVRSYAFVMMLGVLLLLIAAFVYGLR